MVFLDWEKAFDKVTHEALEITLRRFNLDNKIVAIIMAMYNQPDLFVEIDGIKSNRKVQNTGIRQGCPLSPYLFTLVMTRLFEDVHNTDQGRCDRGSIWKHRVYGTNFDEVLYADDTVCIPESVPAMNRLLKLIESESAKYGLQLHKGKCVSMGYGKMGNLHLT